MNKPIQFNFNKNFVIFDPEGALVNSFDTIPECKDWILRNAESGKVYWYRIKRRALV